MKERGERMLAAVPEAMRPLVGELLGDMAGLLARAGEALGRGDMADAAEAAHGLKGMSMAYQLTEAFAAAARAEDRARAGDAAGAVEGLEAFGAVLEALRSAS